MDALTLVGAGRVGVAAARAALDDGVVKAIAVIVDPDQEARTEAESTLGGPGCAALPGCAGLSELALVAFSSRLEPTMATIELLVERGASVVTTCEELAAPPAEMRTRLAEITRSAGRVVIVTGANPGFVMDRLPLLAAGGARAVRRVEVVRRVDTSTRRSSLVTKTGRGLSPADFARRVEEGTIGHVGLEASARLLADGLGWVVARQKTSIEPILVEGSVDGVHQTVELADTAGRTVHLDLTMAWKITDPRDAVTVDGDPPVTIELPGGYHGDVGTSARAVRGLQAVPHLAPGFYRPIDLPVAW